MKAWKCVVIVILLLAMGLGTWRFVSTKDSRKESSDYNKLVRFANRQEVEIAVFRQASILQQLKAEIRKANQEVDAKILKQLPEIKEK